MATDPTISVDQIGHILLVAWAAVFGSTVGAEFAWLAGCAILVWERAIHGGKESHSAWADLPLRSPIRATDNLSGDNIHRYPVPLFIAFVIYKWP